MRARRTRNEKDVWTQANKLAHAKNYVVRDVTYTILYTKSVSKQAKTVGTPYLNLQILIKYKLYYSMPSMLG